MFSLSIGDKSKLIAQNPNQIITIRNGGAIFSFTKFDLIFIIPISKDRSKIKKMRHLPTDNIPRDGISIGIIRL